MTTSSVERYQRSVDIGAAALPRFLTVAPSETVAPSLTDDGPDLVLTAVAGPGTADRGQTVTLTGTVLNQGIGAVGAITDQDVLANGSQVRIGWYLSNNPTITGSDKLLASYTISSLAPGQSIPMTVTAAIPNNIPPGNWYIGAIADFSNAVRESSEVNNALTGHSIGLK